MPFISPSSSTNPKYYPTSPLRLTSLIIFLFPLAAVNARIQLPPNATVPALIVFGDSTVDTGNNNHILTAIKSNYPPYGRDFMGGRPTGRFSNGRIPPDLIVDEVGLKSVLPPYLDPKLKPRELLTGVCFASAFSGYDPITAKSVLVISLPEQLNLFKEYIRRITALVGEEGAKSIVNNSMYIISAGTNDVAVTYFGLPLVNRAYYDFNSYTDLMLTYASSFLQELYGLGARRIAVVGLPPVGCLPVVRTLGSFPTRTCDTDENTVAKIFNSKLSAKLKSLRSTLPNSRSIFVDIYDPLLDIILNPVKYGIVEVTRGCCGTGLIEGAELCNILDPVCPNDTKFLYWDSVHPTEKVYQILVKEVSPVLFSILM